MTRRRSLLVAGILTFMAACSDYDGGGRIQDLSRIGESAGPPDGTTGGSAGSDAGDAAQSASTAD